MSLIETPERRLFSPTEVFGGRFRHPCHNGCGQVMIVPDPCTEGAPEKLEDGQIWACGRCMALHEYYLAYSTGVRHAVVRLLKGVQRREGGEPTVGEFVDG